MASSISSSEWRKPQSKFLKKFSASSQSSPIPEQLCCHYNNHFIVWNQKLKCLHAVDINDSQDHCYTLNPLHEVHFNVHRIQASPSGSVLLCGRRGVIVVILPDQVAFSLDKEIDCKCVPIGEILLMQTPGLEILAAKSFPASENHVALLLNDNTIRVFDVSSHSSKPLKTIQIIRRAMSLSRMSLTIVAATGGQIVDFDFSTPSEMFCLSTSGDVYRIKDVDPSDPLKKPKVSGPLRMLPEADDNHGSEGYSILCFSSEGAIILVLAGTAGTLCHCLVMVDEDDDDDSQLFVIEKVRLSLTLTETYDDCRCPIVIERDSSVSNRYFCFHGSGLHIVVVSFADFLRKFAQQPGVPADSVVDSPDAQCLVEHVVCTRATDKSPDDAPLGACVIPTFPSPNLLVLTSQLKMIDIPLTRYRTSDSLPFQELLSDETMPFRDETPSGVNPVNFEQKIKDILSGSRMPFWAQSEKITDPKELLELALQTTHTFRDRYLVKMRAVNALVDFKSKSLRAMKEEQANDFKRLTADLDEIRDRTSAIQAKFDEVQANSNRQNVRLHSVIQCLQNKHRFKANPEVIEDVLALENRSKCLNSVLSTTKNRVDELNALEGREFTETVGSKKSQTIDDIQIDSLNFKLKNCSTGISELVKDLKTLLDESKA